MKKIPHLRPPGPKTLAEKIWERDNLAMQKYHEKHPLRAQTGVLELGEVLIGIAIAIIALLLAL